MGIFLNPENLLFTEALSSSVYVDKTDFIRYTNSVIGKSGRYICVSRPRRFGKSTTANMLAAYYGRGCDTRDLFDGLSIASADTYEQHINRYNVIRLVMQDFMVSAGSVDGMISGIYDALCDDIEEDYKDYKDINTDGRSLGDILGDLYRLTDTPFVFVIDEWDCVLRYYSTDKASRDKYLEFLDLLLQDRPYVALAYLTGILPVKKNGRQYEIQSSVGKHSSVDMHISVKTHSYMDMFNDFSMTCCNALYKEYTDEICGFTEDEVRRICMERDRDYNAAKELYEGYTIGYVTVYNPLSVTRFLLTGIAKDYWTATESYEALERCLQTGTDGDTESIQRCIAKLLSGESVETDISEFENDFETYMVTDRSLDDALTLFVHLGYLTYDMSAKSVRIPNKELKAQFKMTLGNLRWDSTQ